MKHDNVKSERLYVRVSDSTAKQFKEKCANFHPGTTSYVLQELVAAFIEGRVTLTPPTDVKRSIYDAGN